MNYKLKVPKIQVDKNVDKRPKPDSFLIYNPCFFMKSIYDRCIRKAVLKSSILVSSLEGTEEYPVLIKDQG